MISIKCPQCSKTLKAPPEMAGKRARCPNCKQAVAIPNPQSVAKEPTLEESFGLTPVGPDLGDTSLNAGPLASLEQSLNPLNPLMGETNWGTSAPTPSGPRSFDYIAPASTPTAGWRYWLFSLALLPLAFSLLMPESNRHQAPTPSDESAVSDESEVGSDTIDSSTEGDPNWADEEYWNDQVDRADAHLSHKTWMHWFYALLSGAMFFGLIVVLFEQGQATRTHLLGVGLLTATCGVASLLMFQWFAAISAFMRFGGVLGIFGLIVKLIGFSYACAMDPDNGFLLSLVGFTLGVGLCEEFIKALPILARFRNEYELDWRGACVWGLASGVGFGVAEGIMYSSDYYNGVEGPGIYVVRFISCVALHAIWTGAVGILLWHHQDAVRGEMQWGDWAMAILKVQGASMLLHGLYDTLLKREMYGLALLIALVSFGFLAWLIQWTLKTDQQPKRRVRAAMA